MDADQVSSQALSTAPYQPRAGAGWPWQRWLWVALVLAAWGLRLAPAFDNRLHPDEALYGFWGLRILYGQDPLLLSVPVYKPPLLPYLLAGAQALLGHCELALRFPGLAGGVLLVPLSAQLAGALYRNRRTQSVTALALALSPFAILFGPTAFPDGLMVLLGLGACVAISRGRWGWAGALAGCAFAAKQTGLAWLPLVLGLAWVCTATQRRAGGGRNLLRLAAGLACTAGCALAWDHMRVAQGAESFWSVGVSGYGGLRMIWPHELWPRLQSWAELARYLHASWCVDALLLAGVVALVWRGLQRPHTRAGLADVLLASFCIVYMAVHWLWAFPVWDRYLLPLVPVLAVLLARVFDRLADWSSALLGRTARAPRQRADRVGAALALGLCAALLVGPGVHGAQNGYPVGGDHGSYDGIDQVVAFLRAQPDGTVVYQHWLGWHYDYYLAGKALYLAYWPTPAWLARDVQAFGPRDARFITFPAWETTERASAALATVGYTLLPVLEAPNREGGRAFTVFQIVPAAQTGVSGLAH